MPEFHIDDRVNQKLVELNDAICQFERSTGRGCVLILIPQEKDEDIHVSQDGKPYSKESTGNPVALADAAMLVRESC